MARWLGPWSSDSAQPRVSIQEARIEIGTGRDPMLVRSYFPLGQKPIGALLMLPGMHFLGPSHPRMERLAAVVADAGIMVCTPFIPDYLALSFKERSVHDAQRAFDFLWAHPERPQGKPGVMSISFGCLPAFALIGHQAYADRVGTLLTFGGYRRWRSALRFCLKGSKEVPHDPLNRPIVFANLAEYLPPVNDKAEVIAAWHTFMLRTWGNENMKALIPRQRIAKELGTALSDDGRQLFLQGCGLKPGGDPLIDAAIDAATHLDWLDPAPHLENARCPLVAVHAVDDDVIRPEQSQWLLESWPEGLESKRLLTGLYSHSGQLENEGRRRGLAPMASEVKTMLNVLSALMDCGTMSPVP